MTKETNTMRNHITDILVVYTQHWHLYHPMRHHRQYPSENKHGFQHDLALVSSRQQYGPSGSYYHLYFCLKKRRSLSEHVRTNRQTESCISNYPHLSFYCIQTLFLPR